MNRTPHGLDADTLSRILEEQGRRQDWLAKQVGVSPSNVTRWCNGTLPIGEEYLDKIALALDIPLFLLAEFRKWNDAEPNKELAS